MKGLFTTMGLLLLAGQLYGEYNLLLNGDFRFSSFNNSREAQYQKFHAGSVPFWDQERYGDVKVLRAPRVAEFRPQFPVDGLVVIRPGKTLRQFSLLSEMELDHGESVSLTVHGYQGQPHSLKATIAQMQIDNASGEWSPAEFGQNDERQFPRRSRGELVRVELKSGLSGEKGDFRLDLAKATILGEVSKAPAKESDDLRQTIGLQIEFTNVSNEDVWIYAPCLAKGEQPQSRLPALRKMPGHYKHLPRTISKLRRGQPLHVIAMGSSIDRGSANPPMYLYDEDPSSPRFKQPISKADNLFDGEIVGRPEWTPYVGQWRHYFSAVGRLRAALLTRYDYPPGRLLFNFAACDGSSIGESHSALAEWSTLAHTPKPELNGHALGASWQELYPSLFERSEGTGPDLVIFGSGANEKIDGEEEVAVFEGAIRWYQRNHPDVEFLFCMWDHCESSPTNTGMLKELALRYGIPLIDMARELNLSTRHVNPFALRPGDGHPQAAAHYLWGKMLERAFQVTDPIEAGVPQAYLPSRVSNSTIGWEGEMRSYDKESARIRGGAAFILDDTVVNLWATSSESKVSVFVDGETSAAPHWRNGSRYRLFSERDPRNSTFAMGNLALGDQHIVEVGKEARIEAVDSKVVLNRIWYGVDGRSWKHEVGAPESFASEWGAPYGATKLILKPGQIARLEWVGTDCSIAWLAQGNGGTLVARVNGSERLRVATGEPVKLASAETLFMENRKGILNLPFGVHRLEVEAVEQPIALLGAFTYDTRPNRQAERRLQGMAAPGETIHFSAPYRATPLILCSGGLKVQAASEREVTFAGEAAGGYEVIGQ